MTRQPKITDFSAPAGRDWPFFAVLCVVAGTYVLLIVALLAANVSYLVSGAGGFLRDNPLLAALADPKIRYAIKLSLLSCTLTAVLSLLVAVPTGYLLSRVKFPGRNFIDAVLDIPIVLPPLVIGLSLLILFQFFPRAIREAVVYELPAVILAQFMVACAFAVRAMRATFDQINVRREQVALTLGASRSDAFFLVVLPEAWRGMITALTLAWARALGEFGPLLVFAGATRMKTEVLSTTIFLELSVGDLTAAVSVSLIMVIAALVVLMIARIWGMDRFLVGK